MVFEVKVEVEDNVWWYLFFDRNFDKVIMLFGLFVEVLKTPINSREKDYSVAYYYKPV